MFDYFGFVFLILIPCFRIIISFKRIIINFCLNIILFKPIIIKLNINSFIRNNNSIFFFFFLNRNNNSLKLNNNSLKAIVFRVQTKFKKNLISVYGIRTLSDIVIAVNILWFQSH